MKKGRKASFKRISLNFGLFNLEKMFTIEYDFRKHSLLSKTLSSGSSVESHVF